MSTRSVPDGTQAAAWTEARHGVSLGERPRIVIGDTAAAGDRRTTVLAWYEPWENRIVVGPRVAPATVAHEMEHWAQVRMGRPWCEAEAYEAELAYAREFGLGVVGVGEVEARAAEGC